MKTVLLLGLLLAGCTDPYRALYEGIRNRNEMMRSPMERAIKPSPSYDSYRKDRERLVNPEHDEPKPKKLIHG